MPMRGPLIGRGWRREPSFSSPRVMTRAPRATARLHAAVVANRPELHVRVSPWVKRRRREGVVVHWGSVVTRRFRGIRITSPTQTLLD